MSAVGRPQGDMVIFFFFLLKTFYMRMQYISRAQVTIHVRT